MRSSPCSSEATIESAAAELSNKIHLSLYARHPQVEEVHLIGLFLEAANYPQMASPRERRFKSKVNFLAHREFNFFEHQPASTKRRGFRRKGRQSLRDQVRIDKIQAVRVIRQEFPRKRSLARAVRSRNDVDIWAHENSRAYLHVPCFAGQVHPQSQAIPGICSTGTPAGVFAALSAASFEESGHAPLFHFVRCRFHQTSGYPAPSKLLTSNS